MVSITERSIFRFKANDKAVLIASDVAARGLDIPLVEHVIHYQLPRSGEIYVHRSGRTARANHDGVSLLLCVPEEHKLYTKLCQTLKGGKQYPDFPVDVSILKEMKKRVKLATEIDKLEHQEQKVISVPQIMETQDLLYNVGFARGKLDATNGQ